MAVQALAKHIPYIGRASTVLEIVRTYVLMPSLIRQSETHRTMCDGAERVAPLILAELFFFVAAAAAAAAASDGQNDGRTNHIVYQCINQRCYE
ncbi:uncharacterized protein UTRI_05949 [Ustilago trichophora]|uniref:Uncharacterized protein n=1 Tax=Ustilago trichophora TaxID=86804 RepID=A0A5C3EIQ9_9BASI|nr:uncharacterized protein UTRI_05949 [Ustilago trichophora]